MEEEGGGKVRVLIEKATTSTEPEVDPRLLKAIKSVVRRSDSELRLAAHILMDLMKREHSQVLCIYIISLSSIKELIFSFSSAFLIEIYVVYFG